MAEPLSLKVGVHPNHFLYGTYENLAISIESFNPNAWPAIIQPPNMMAALGKDPLVRSIKGQASEVANSNFRADRNGLLLPKLEGEEPTITYSLALGERAVKRTALCSPDALAYARDLNGRELVSLTVLSGDAPTTADWDGGFVLINWSDGSQTSEVGVTNDGDETYFHYSDKKLAKLRARWEEIDNHAEPLEEYLRRTGFTALSAS